jgi:phosphoserine phosphatase
MDNVPPIYIVDVCGTLVRDDTTLGLLFHHFGRKPGVNGRYSVLCLIAARSSPLRLAFAVLEKLSGRHWLKHAAVRLLDGESSAALEQSAREYAQYLLSHRRVATVWSAIADPLKSHDLILASASLEPIVSALAEQIGVGYVASSLQHFNGRLTGRYARDLSGAKDLALTEKFGADLLARPYCAISDNYTDKDLLVRARKCFVVVQTTAQRGRWAGVDAEFLEGGV